jgi:hypothetical protein
MLPIDRVRISLQCEGEFTNVAQEVSKLKMKKLKLCTRENWA